MSAVFAAGNNAAAGEIWVKGDIFNRKNQKTYAPETKKEAVK